MPPKVSILICAYNAGSYLQASVESALRQDYSNLEVVLIDDGSTDGSIHALSRTILADNRLRICHQPNRGKANALNHGISKCCGSYIALQDADDISQPNRVSLQLRTMQENPALAVVFCGHFLIWMDSPIAPVCIHSSVEQSKAKIEDFRMPGHDPTMMFRRNVADSFRFDEQLPIVEGYDFILRVGESHPMVNIGTCLYGYRVHLSSITKSDPRKRDLLVVDLLKKTCARRGISFPKRFPHLLKVASGERQSSALNDMLSHCTISSKSSVLNGNRIKAVKLAAWMFRRWPVSRDTYKALAFSVMPRLLIKKD